MLLLTMGVTLSLFLDQMLPYRESRFYQTLNMKVHENATMLYSEIIVPGK